MLLLLLLLLLLLRWQLLGVKGGMLWAKAGVAARGRQEVHEGGEGRRRAVKGSGADPAALGPARRRAAQ